MKPQNQFLKNILTTASTLSLIIGSASEAGAAAVQRSTANSHTAGQSWGGGTNTDVFTSGNSILLDAATDNIGINSVVNVAGIDLNGLTPTGVITAQFSGATLGAVGNSLYDTILGPRTIPLIINDGITLTLSGTTTIGGVVEPYDYGGLGNVTLGNTNSGGAASVLTITGVTTGAIPRYYFAINSFTGAVNPGVLNINNAVLFQSATIGGDVPLSAINITNDGTWEAGLTSASATKINLTSSTSSVRLCGGAITGDINNISGGVGTTKVNITGDVTVAGSIGATGVNNAISSVYFGTDSTLTISGNRHIYGYIIPYTNREGALRLSGGTTTLHYNVGDYTGGYASPTKALRFINLNDQTLVIDSTLGNFYVAGEITATTDGAGTITTQGVNPVYLFNDIGYGTGIISTINANANTTLYGARVNAVNINIASGKTLTIDSTSASRSIAGAINGVGSGDGTLLIQGTDVLHERNVDINSSVGSTHALSSISVTQVAGSTITFHENVSANNIDASTAGSTVNFNGNVTSIGAFSTSTSDYNVIAGNVSVAIATFLGNTSVGGNITATNIYLNGQTLTMTGAKTIQGGLYTTGDAGTGGTFAINGNNVRFQPNIGGSNIGGTGHSLTAINLASNNTLTINTNNGACLIYAPFTTSTTNQGTLSFAGSNIAMLYQNIGASTKILSTVNVGSDIILASTATDIWANNISHTDSVLNTSAHDVTLHGNYSGVDSTATLGEKKLTITGGAVTLAGALVINATYTGEDQVMLDLSNATSMDASAVTALKLNIDNNGMTPASNSIITVIKTPGDTTLPTITTSLGTSDPKWRMLTFGVLTYDPPSIGNSAIVKSTPVSPAGFIPVGASSQNIAQAALTLGGATKINDNGIVTFNLTNTQLNLVNSDITIRDTVVPIGSGNGVSVNSNIAAYTNQFSTSGEQKGVLAIIGQTVNANPNIVLDTSTTQIVGILASNAGMIPNDIGIIMTEPDLTGTALALVQELSKVVSTGGAEAMRNLLSHTNSASTNANNIVINNISTRIIETSRAMTLLSSADKADGIVVANNKNPGDDLGEIAQGISAGSNAYDKYGVWMSANAGKALQKEYKGEDGFKSHAEGFAIGVDTMLNERASIGVAVSNNFDHIKYRNSGNKTDASSWVGAIYGNHKLKNNWFIKGTALFNRTRMNSKELRVIYGGYGIARAKYNLISYGGEASVGFMHRFRNDMILTPTIGFRMIHNNGSHYGQYGNTHQNNTLSTNSMNHYSALGGLSLSKNFMKYDILFTPEARVNIQYGINQQAPKGVFVSALAPNQPNNFIGTKSNKITSTYGLGLTGSSYRIECGITGDVTIANKYVGYQGSVKVKVKF